MSIEVPNAILATALVFPLELSPDLDTPLVSSRGFQAYDASSVAPDIEGGFTRVAEGQYFMRTLDGCDLLEGIVLIQPAAPTFYTAAFLPYNEPSLDGNLGAGDVIGIIFGGIGGDTPTDTSYQIRAFRYATQPGLVSSGLTP